MLQVKLSPTATVFSPGARINGTLAWEFPKKRQHRVELVLFWFTEGTGNTDVGIIASQSFSGLSGQGERPFEFTAPASPQSFRGRLIRLRWAIEAKADAPVRGGSVRPGKVDRLEFDIAAGEKPAQFENGLEPSAS